MTSLDLHSEPFTPHGGVDGKATRRAIGKPDLDFWELFLRETLQNSWDARLDRSNGAIRFVTEAYRFSEPQRAVLRDHVFTSVPPGLREFRRSLIETDLDVLDVLVVSDAHTRGLGGSTRADLATPEGESRDFVDFIRNVGRAASKEIGGGTYGFGKGVLYDASSVNTCLIYSQTLVDGALERRFIAMSVGEQYEDAGRRFTGRHWWGNAAADGVLEPLTGEAAFALAQSLNMAGMGRNATGTSIAVLSPVREGESNLAAVVGRIAEAIDKWAWPHRVDLGGGPNIEFVLRFQGEEVGLADLTADPLFEQYVRAYEQAMSAETAGEYGEQWPWTIKSIDSLRPIQHLGVLAYRKVPVGGEALDESRRQKFGHHIALMRSPRFVVKYLPVADDPTGQAVVGVFIAAPGADEEFAKAEPVAHDDWVPGEQEGRRTSAVRIALNHVREEFKNQRGGKLDARGSEHASGTAMVARILGGALSGVAGHGAEVQRHSRGSGGGGGGSKSGVSVLLEPYPDLRVDDGGISVDFGFEVRTSGADVARDYLLEGEARIVLDGGALEPRDDIELGVDRPHILGWYSDGLLVSDASEVRISELGTGPAVLRVRQPPNTAVTVEIRPKKVES